MIANASTSSQTRLIHLRARALGTLLRAGGGRQRRAGWKAAFDHLSNVGARWLIADVPAAVRDQAIAYAGAHLDREVWEYKRGRRGGRERSGASGDYLMIPSFGTAGSRSSGMTKAGIPVLASSD